MNHFVCRQKITQIMLPPEIDQLNPTTDTLTDYLKIVEDEYGGIRKTLQNDAVKKSCNFKTF